MRLLKVTESSSMLLEACANIAFKSWDTYRKGSRSSESSLGFWSNFTAPKSGICSNFKLEHHFYLDNFIPVTLPPTSPQHTVTIYSRGDYNHHHRQIGSLEKRMNTQQKWSLIYSKFYLFYSLVTCCFSGSYTFLI